MSSAAFCPGISPGRDNQQVGCPRGRRRSGRPARPGHRRSPSSTGVARVVGVDDVTRFANRTTWPAAEPGRRPRSWAPPLNERIESRRGRRGPRSSDRDGHGRTELTVDGHLQRVIVRRASRRERDASNSDRQHEPPEISLIHLRHQGLGLRIDSGEWILENHGARATSLHEPQVHPVGHVIAALLLRLANKLPADLCAGGLRRNRRGVRPAIPSGRRVRSSPAASIEPRSPPP